MTRARRGVAAMREAVAENTAIEPNAPSCGSVAAGGVAHRLRGLLMISTMPDANELTVPRKYPTAEFEST